MKNQLYEEIVSYIIENQSRFYRLAYSYTGNREAALDVVQNAVSTALEKYRTIRKSEYMKTWFYRVLVNESLTYIRDNGREVLYEPLDLSLIHIFGKRLQKRSMRRQPSTAIRLRN